jgi:hypothetical protein
LASRVEAQRHVRRFRDVRNRKHGHGAPVHIGIAVDLTGITISRMREGMIAEVWVERDALGLTKQFGVAQQSMAQGAG